MEEAVASTESVPLNSADETEVWSDEALELGGGEDDDVGSYTSSTDDGDYEDVEPKLKYERLGNDLTNIFKKDSASCIAVNSRFLVLGSHWGMIYVLDHLGNAARGHELQAHAVSVNQISLDSEGDYIASCSDDGRVVVHGWYNTDNTHNLSFDRPMKSVALDPNYYKPRSGRKFLTGDEQLILHEKAFLNMQKQTVLHSGDGAVRTIKWNKDNFVAWATDAGVRVSDMTERRIISLIKRDHDPKYRPELLRCHLCWQDGKTLLIGWADTVKICVIRRNREPPQPYHDSPSHLVEIVSMFTTDFFICGLAPLLNPGGGFSRSGEFGTPHLVVLSVVKEEGVVVSGPGGAVGSKEDPKRPQECSVPARGQRPLLRIIEPRVHDYVEVSTDILTVNNYQEYKINDYHMDCLIEEGLFFIVSPKDVVVGKPRDADDHIDWLLERCKFEEALNTVENSGKGAFSVSMTASRATAPSAMLTRHTLLDVGLKYLEHLVSTERFEEAARNMPKILGRHKNLWELEAYRFATANQLKALAPYLPKGEEFRLDPMIYEMVLFDYLKTDTEGFLRILREWPDKLYNVVAVINVVLDHSIAQPENQTLLRALAHLYSLSRQFRKALDIYLKLKHKDVFELIDKYELVDSIKDLVPGLMELDAERAVRLFRDHVDKLPPDVVVQKLGKHAFFLYKYLDALYKKDGRSMKRDYHGKLVELYSIYDREKLLPFLQSSSVYSLQDAYGICQKANSYPEMVYLLTRMGNTRQGLKLIMENLEDVNKAIEYCKEHDDRDLWHDLIQHSLDKPKFIAELLLNIGTHVDPLILIRRIKDGLVIPGLRDALVKILRDYNLQVALQEGFQSILVSDCFSLQKRLVFSSRGAARLLHSSYPFLLIVKISVSQNYTLSMAAAAPNLPAISPPVLPNGSPGVQHRGLLTVEFDVDEWRFVLELYNVRSKTKDQELSSTICSVVTDAVVEIKRLSANLALAVFDTIEHAQTALRIQTHLFSARTIVLASEEARSKIRQMGLHHSLKPAIRRPVEDSLPRCTSIGIRVNDDIRSLCRSVDMVSVVESLTSDSSVADRIDAFLGVVQINEHDLGRGMDIVNQVEQIFRKKYPNCVATVFGSVVAGLGLKGSDLDVYIELGDDPSRRKTDTEYVNETAPLLYGHEKEFIILRKIPTARVPIIRLFSTALSTSLDISFSNSMGVCNSRLMKSYMTFDPAVHKVVQIVRWWAKVRAMTSRQGGFTSYSVVWFVLFFFMNRTKRPKVPSPYSVLQTAKAMGVATVLDGWQCGVVPIHMVPEVSTYEIDPNPPSIPDLLCEFFKFYTEYDFASVVTCTFLGRTLPRAMFGDPRLLLPRELDDYVEAFSRPGFEPLEVDHSFVTQDPFRLEQNLNRNTLVNNCERFVIECRRSEWTLRETMALGTPQEGMYAMLQLALGENQARRAASSVYNDQVLPQCPHKYPEYQGGIFVTFGQATVSKRFVRESRLEVVGRSPEELSRMHLVAWRDKVVATSFKILGDCLLMDVWDLCGVPGPDAMDDPYSVAMYNAPIPPVTRAQCADFLTQPFSYTESAGVNFRALSLPGWLNLWQQFDKDYFVRPGLMRSFHAMRGKRVVDMINAGPQCNSGLLLKRFFCEARWPTFTVRRDAGKAGTFAEEASWSAVIVRALNGSFEGRIDDRPLPKFNYIVEFYELQGMPLNGLLIRCLHAPVSPDGFILSCGLDHSLAVFLRSLLTSELRRMDAAVVFPSNH